MAPLQSAKLPLQLNPQVFIAHVRVALARVGHTVPHAPQWLTSLDVVVSQPSPPEPLQLPKPVLHEKPQAPAVHVALALKTDGHAAMHALQWFGLVRVLTQVELHKVSPAPQPETHTPAWHVGVPPLQVFAQEPQ